MRSHGWLVGAVLALVAVLVPLSGGSASGGSVSAGEAGLSVPGHVLLSASPEVLARDLDRVAGTGVGWVRVDVPWSEIEGTRGAPNWSNVDRVVAAASARGLRVLGIVTTLPGWARPAGTGWNYGPRSDAERAAFADFAGRVAARYADSVGVWEVWNEPNLDQFWAPTPSAGDFAKLLSVTYPAIKRAAPQARVVAGGTGWPGGAPDIATVDWYRGLYGAGGGAFFDAAAVHPYPDFSAVSGGEMGKATQVRAVMDAAGDSTKQLWGTETGAPTGGASSTTEANQAALLTQSFQYWAGIHDHGPLFYYTINDTGGTDREGYFGLVRTDGSHKPAYQALRALSASASPPAATPTRPVRVTGRQLLARLAVQPPEQASSGSRWPSTSEEGTACSVRTVVLQQESTRPAAVTDRCFVEHGRWVSRYDGRVRTDPTRLAVLGIVPRREAWRSGAAAWRSDRRLAYATDTGHRWTLEAVTKAVARDRAGQDVVRWLPDRRSCTYALRWTGVKYRWRLAVDPREVRRLKEVFSGRCGSRTVVLPSRAQL